MNRSILYLIFLQLSVNAGGLYNLDIRKADGTLLQMSSLAGKKIIIIGINTSNANSAILYKLDSIQKVNANLAIIVIPAIDFIDSSAVIANNTAFVASSGLIITDPGKVKKIAGAGQCIIFQWLTNVSWNKHFDRDVEEDGQLFFISEKGILYGILGKEATAIEIRTTLQQQIRNVE